MSQSLDEYRRQVAELQAEIDELRGRAEGAEDALTAIQNGEVDALVVYGKDGEQVYTLEGADHTYRVIVEKIQEGVATLQPDGMILYANQRLADMLGIPLQHLLGGTLLPHVHSGDQKIYTSLLARSDHDGANRAEVTLRRGDGGVVPVQLAMNLVESLGECFICLVATDLTEQKRQEAILKAEQLSRSILEQAAEIIVVCDRQGTVTRVSQAADDFLPGNPLLQPFEQVFPLQAAAGSEQELFSIQSVLSGNCYRGVDAVMERPGANGVERLHLLVSATPLRGEEEGILGCIVTLTDITARNQAETALRESEERYRSLVEHSPLAIIIQVEGRYVYVNPAAVKQFGATRPEEILGQTILERTHPSHRETVIERVHVTNEERRPAGLVEGMFLRLDGTPFYTEATSVPFNYQGKAGALVMAQDVTGRRVLEAQSRVDAARIEVQRHLIDQREQERLRIARDLHDGPVQELIGIAYALHGLAQERAEEDPKDELRPIAQAIMDQIAELRAYAGELRPPTLFRFGLVKALRSHLETLGEKHPELVIALEVDCKEENLTNEIRLGLFRIYQEAVNNIVRHARATHVEVHFHQDDTRAELEISDDGVGFTLPGDWLELARRGHLGLVGMRERTEAMGGTIRVSSLPGVTRIEVSVPLGILGEGWKEAQ
jgi:PAS domain S-box-containing protein